MARMKVFPERMPAASIGAMITMPSGIFCRAIPPAMISACVVSPEPKPTPAAMPSGRLCMAIAKTNSRTLLRFALWCASGSSPTNLCKCGTNLSMRLRQTAPAKIPATVISIPYFPPYSRDGTISPSTAAASITPAANDRMISENLCDMFLKIKPISEPITVAPPTPRAVSNTSSIIYPSAMFASLLSSTISIVPRDSLTAPSLTKYLSIRVTTSRGFPR